MSLSLTHPVSSCKLWIDGVGCWMICFESELVLGNPIPVAGRPKSKIIADLGTEHALINFHESSFWLKPKKAVSVDEVKLTQKTSLSHGTHFKLGEDVELRFEQSSPLSLSSTLKLESGHRFHDGVDGCVLFQKTCVLGFGENKHIDCRGWSSDVILFERENQLYCKSTAGNISTDGVEMGAIVKVQENTHLEGSDWSMRVEVE